MSAIAGILRLDGQPVDRRHLERMTGALRAHGPDRRGVYAAGEIGLAHLLMQLTPEDLFDRQPLRGASGAVMAADVRLDNRDDVSSALALDRDEAKMASDSALVLAAWERWGDEVWARLRGPFAAAIWNPDKRALTLARDPMGLGLVVWHRGPRFFAFATLPKGLFALPDVPREISEEKFADFLVLNHAEHETTLYRDVFRLPPAHIAGIDTTGRVQMRRYWSADDITPVRLKSDEAYAEAMREQLDRAVRRQLRSVHPVGCFLSGGLDSSSVAALAARALAEQGKRLAAYTQVPRKGFDGRIGHRGYIDETPFVEAIRQALPTIDVTYVDNSACDDFAELEGVFHATDMPVRGPTNLGWYMQIIRLARANKQRVLLCGDFGNATISWDGWAQAADHLVAGRLWAAYRVWRQLYRASSNSRWTVFRWLFVDRLTPARFAAWATRLSHPRSPAPWQYHAAIRPDFAAAMGVEARARRVGHDFLYRRHTSWRERTAALMPVDYRGEWYAGALAAHGVEMRDPTSDLDVVSFCLGVPVEQFLVEGVSRSLVRRALWGILPPKVLANRRRGAHAPDWFEKLGRRKAAMEAEIADLDRSVLARKAIDLDRLRTAVREWPSENGNDRQILDEYQLALPRGLAMGRFARWFERTN